MPPTSPSETSSPPGRRRSDGERTHAAILDVATQIASVEGIYGLTIGRLAEELGVSKSGVYAHFGSKEQLQLETIEAARAIFEREVLAPTLQAPQGLPRLVALSEAYLSYIERQVFAGGCFFSSLLAEMDARSGPLRDLVRAAEQEELEALGEAVREAQRQGEAAADIDAEEVAFELKACLDLASYHFALFEDPQVLDRARGAVAGLLERVRTPSQARARDRD